MKVFIEMDLSFVPWPCIIIIFLYKKIVFA